MIARREVVLHAVRLLGAGAVFVLCARWPVAALAAAVGVFLAAFAFNHDALHGALRLPRPVNEVLLTVLGLVMGWSGFGVRRMHLLHHARPLREGDVEGFGATLPFWAAVRAGPMNAARYRVEGCTTLRARLENAAVVGLVVAALMSRTVLGAAWVVATVAMHLTATVWASWLPHRPPVAMVRAARRLVWTHSAVVLSFVFHDEHHRRPKVPCGALGG